MNSKPTNKSQLSQNQAIIKKKTQNFIACLLWVWEENSQQLKITKIYDLSEVLKII